MRPWAQAKRLPWLSITPPASGPSGTWQQLLLSLGQGPGRVPLGLTLIEAQKYARRAEQLAVLKTFAEGELLRRLPFRNLVGGSLSFSAETKLPRVGFRAVNEGYRQSYGVINPIRSSCTCSAATWMWTARSWTCRAPRPAPPRPR